MNLILLVEDQAETVTLLQSMLLSAGFATHRVANGGSALAYLDTTLPALVLLDWSLPSVDGLGMLTSIRLRVPHDLPVILMAEPQDPVDLVRALNGGADGFLRKPLAEHDLLALIQALLRRSERLQRFAAQQASAAKLLHYGELVLNLTGRRAYLRGAEVRLTRGEFELLALLMREPGRMFQRAEALHNLWQCNYVPGDRSIDNFVLRLRRKLGDHGEYLETVWGLGYRLRAYSSPHTSAVIAAAFPTNGVHSLPRA